jgi:hypothetical protein
MENQMSSSSNSPVQIGSYLIPAGATSQTIALTSGYTRFQLIVSNLMTQTANTMPTVQVSGGGQFGQFAVSAFGNNAGDFSGTNTGQVGSGSPLMMPLWHWKHFGASLNPTGVFFGIVDVIQSSTTNTTAVMSTIYLTSGNTGAPAISSTGGHCNVCGDSLLIGLGAWNNGNVPSVFSPMQSGAVDVYGWE